MTINYKTLTVEQIEEHVEFIDWSMVPSYLITDELKTIFKSIPQLQARIWFEDLMSQMVIKEDQVKFQNRIYFFIKDKWCMEYVKSTNCLYCSYYRVWLLLTKKYNFNQLEFKNFIHNLVLLHFKEIEINSNYYTLRIETGFSYLEHVEQHFNK